MTDELDDKLNRKDEAKFLINYLTKRYEVKDKEDSFVLNINAKWGYGKTFFLQLLEKELKERKHEVIFFDAWKNDFTKEPLLAFFSEINSSLENYLESYNEKENPLKDKIKKSALPIIGSIITKQLTGMSIDKINTILDEEEKIEDDTSTNIENSLSSIISKTTELALKEHQTLKNSIEDFKENMKSILELIKIHKKELPLFILIDELDRCRPNYAIELLENIKHIFDIKGIYFIIATNSKQLSHSINAIYGANFSSEIYLKRFFDLEYNLKEPDKYEYINFLFEKEIISHNILFNPLSKEIYLKKNLHCILIQAYSDYFNLTLRDIRQVINTLSTILLTWKEEEEVQLGYLLYFVVCKQKSEELFIKAKNILNTQKTLENINLNDDSKVEFYEYIEDMRFDKRTKTIKISIISLINHYINILSSKDFNIKETKFVELNKIRSYFINRPHEIRYKLKNYPNLVSYAGQLK